MQPTISEALGNCHCLNGDFQFRAPTRNPVFAACTVCYLGCFLDSASERGMTITICSAGFAIRRFLIADLQSAHAHTFISWQCDLSGLQILILLFGGLQIRQNILATA